MDNPAPRKPPKPETLQKLVDLSGYRGLPAWMKPPLHFGPWYPRRRTEPRRWRKNLQVPVEKYKKGSVWMMRECRWPGCQEMVNASFYEWCYTCWRIFPNKLRSALGEAIWRNQKMNESDGATILYRYRANRMEDWMREHLKDSTPKDKEGKE